MHGQQTGGNVGQDHTASDNSALHGTANQHNIYPSVEDKYDILTLFASTRQEIKSHLQQRCVQLSHIKWYLNIHVELVRESNEDQTETAQPFFRSNASILLSENDEMDHLMNEAYQKIFKSFDEFVRKGSGWTLKKIISLEVHTVQYKPLGGSSYIELPTTLKRAQAVVNVKNTDHKCFLWSVLASLHPQSIHPERVSHYLKHESEIDVNGIEFPVTLSKISKFEKQNDISVNVLGFEENTIFPLYISTRKGARHEVDLLYLQKGDNSHYCWIKNLSRFLARTKPKHHSYHFCRYCLQGFQGKHTLDRHLQYCSRYDAQCTTMPQRNKDDVLTFTDFHKQLRVPFVIYADFETFAQQMDTCHPDPSQSSTTSIMQFEPCGYGYQVVCTDERYTKSPVIYRGDNVSENFLHNIMKEEEEIKDILKQVEPMNLSQDEEQRFQSTTECHICQKPFKNQKVRDHCHLSGKYRGAACQDCNLNFRHPAFIPVIFHNLRNFDGHILCHAVGAQKHKRLTCVPHSMEKYISFSLGNLRFIDSYQFLNCSLAELINNLAEEGLSPFTQFNKEFVDKDQARLMLRKGVYPYEYVDSSDKFCETELPPLDAFYSHLTKSNISNLDYQHAQLVWNTMGIRNIGEYHDLYLKTDVLLLADCFERFRNTCQNHYKLDPCHFYTSPGLAWAAALKMTNCSLSLLTDPDMYLFFENGVRGGISVISQRYAKANNKNVPEFDPSQPKSYIEYWDANNLYGWSMCQALPQSNFSWLTDKEIDDLQIDQIDDDANTGYILECDIAYPKELHDVHNQYPVAVEQRNIPDNMLSPYSRQLWKHLHPTSQRKSLDDGKLYPPRPQTPKLIPSLENKQKYILHYRNLKQYLQLGLKLGKIHRVIKFKQSPWLKPYIQFNTEMRKNAKNEFERCFFKLMNNAVFGKTMENLRKRVDIQLVHTQKKLNRRVSKSSFKRFTIFNKNLVGVENKKVQLRLNKPVYVGQAILDLSKVLMYQFHYNFVLKKYGDDAKLLFTDTDSLCYHIKTSRHGGKQTSFRLVKLSKTSTIL